MLNKKDKIKFKYPKLITFVFISLIRIFFIKTQLETAINNKGGTIKKIAPTHFESGNTIYP